jgi:hypothetical protein
METTEITPRWRAPASISYAKAGQGNRVVLCLSVEHHQGAKNGFLWCSEYQWNTVSTKYSWFPLWQKAFSRKIELCQSTSLRNAPAPIEVELRWSSLSLLRCLPELPCAVMERSSSGVLPPRWSKLLCGKSFCESHLRLKQTWTDAILKKIVQLQIYPLKPSAAFLVLVRLSF